MAEQEDPQAALAFGRAFIATQYLLGRRNADLAPPSGSPAAALEHCETLVQHLGAPDKQARAKALAAEVALLMKALQRREIA